MVIVTKMMDVRLIHEKASGMDHHRIDFTNCKFIAFFQASFRQLDKRKVQRSLSKGGFDTI